MENALCRFSIMMKWNSLNRLFLVLVIALGSTINASATNSEEDALKRIQQAKYNMFTGNWDVHLKTEMNAIAESVKQHMTGIDYTLVDEKLNGSKLSTLTFRGEGDQKVVIKLKRYEAYTNFRIRIGLFGSESKSAQIFNYLFRKM